MTGRAAAVAASVLAVAGTGTYLAATGDDGPPERSGGGTSFDIGCGYSHSNTDDPIVMPGFHGMSHEHDFFGFTGTTGDTTSDDLQDALAGADTPTTCTEFNRDGGPKAANASAYWTPAMRYCHTTGPVRTCTRIYPDHAHIYYRNDSRQTVSVFDPDHKMIAGHPNATVDQARAEQAVRWYCGGPDLPRVVEIPPDCDNPQIHGITAEIRFDPCNNGQPDSTDHQSHMKPFSKRGGGCPGSHATKLPRILMLVSYPVERYTRKPLDPADDQILVASGGMWTMHADQMFGWDMGRLQTLIDECLNVGRDCKRDPPPLE